MTKKNDTKTDDVLIKQVQERIKNETKEIKQNDEYVSRGSYHINSSVIKSY